MYQTKMFCMHMLDRWCTAHLVQVVVLPDPCRPTNMTTFGLPFFRALLFALPLPPFFSFSFGFGAPLWAIHSVARRIHEME